MTDTLPHDTYMAAVAIVLTVYGVEPTRWWTAAGSGSLEATFEWDDSIVREHWPHGGVCLTWNQKSGWLLGSGGSRRPSALSPDSWAYGDPRQVGADVRARLVHGPGQWTPGPICTGGDHWDPRPTQAAVERWETAAA